MSINIEGPIPRWQILGGAAIVGVAMIAAPRILLPESTFWSTLVEIFDGIGIAILTSSILGFTIERWLRADLTKDVFLTAIGHHLPNDYREALKAELMRLSAYTFLCEKHILSIKIEPIDGTCVRVTTMVERTMRNITRSDQRIAGHIHIDEWNFPAEKSRICECKVAKIGGGTKDSASFTKVDTHDNLSISATTKEIKIAPDESAKLSLKSVEIKRPTDDLSLVFMRPTINPTIEVSVPPELTCKTSFGPDEESAIDETYSNRRTLKGMYWPPQRMRIHWWKTI